MNSTERNEDGLLTYMYTWSLSNSSGGRLQSVAVKCDNGQWHGVTVILT